MTRLTRVELRRMWARRLPLVTAALTGLVVVLALVATAQQIGTLDEQRAQAREWYEQALADYEISQSPEAVEDCLEQQDRERELSGTPDLEFGCEYPQPQLSDFLTGPSSLLQVYDELVVGLAMVPVFLAAVQGSTAVAAEFTTRAIGTWLTFEPRRDRVWGSKVLAAAVGTLPMGVVFAVLLGLGGFAVFRFLGQPVVLTTDEWVDVGWTLGRCVLLVAVVGAVGAALGFLFRHTGAVIGLALGYAVVVEGVLASTVPSFGRWLLSRNVTAWVQDGTRWSTFDCGRIDQYGGCLEVVHVLELPQAAALLAGLSAAALALAWWVFRRRDVD